MHIEHLSIGYGTRTLLSDVTLTLEGGQLVALLGRNGTGKSTLLRALAGLEPCRTGEVWLDGRPLSTLDAGERSRRVSLVTTEKVAVPHLRVHELVAMGRAPYTNWVGRLSAADEAAIARALELTGMSAYASRPTDSLSDGESQRVMIARALRRTPRSSCSTSRRRTSTCRTATTSACCSSGSPRSRGSSSCSLRTNWTSRCPSATR